MVSKEEFKQSFEPISDDCSEILILGSMPGDRSIADNEYYSHPRNRFWPLICKLTGSETPCNYNDKNSMLLNNKIALWDVVYKANRPGSLDSNIANEKPNNINRFIQSHKKLKTIVFNGAAAQKLYHKYFTRIAHISYYKMPSTSPANAAATLDKLTTAWSTAF
ncbi:MAG: DNA-deoxyinosine glycosylase [Bacteroidales bacterium]|jgi:hypoxanthine-DNA glycosylase|nr:DNA-deoxyinosine glycosylase [Bacteroidales bacterium]